MRRRTPPTRAWRCRCSSCEDNGWGISVPTRPVGSRPRSPIGRICGTSGLTARIRSPCTTSRISPTGCAVVADRPCSTSSPCATAVTPAPTSSLTAARRASVRTCCGTRCWRRPARWSPPAWRRRTGWSSATLPAAPPFELAASLLEERRLLDSAATIVAPLSGRPMRWLRQRPERLRRRTVQRSSGVCRRRRAV